jgi:putative MATE family efflux protein
MFAAGAALRGAGDTLTPSIAMVIVDVVNFFCTVGLTHGRFGLPAMGFDGIAIGTCIAYAVGGLMLLAILLKRRGFMRLYPHRMRPHWAPLKRILRLGLPNGVESGLHWIANFAVVGAANHLGNAAVTAHWNAIRIESVSFLTGMGFAVAAQTLVGQSLGMGDPRRARRCAYLAYAMGGGAMTVAGVVFILFARPLAQVLSRNPEVIEMTATCMRITGGIQFAFAASLIFGSAMRGAGDTLRVMQLNLATIFGIRFVGVVLVVYVFGLGLQAVWLCLCGDLLMRGLLMAGRFRYGAWDRARV